jgi:hypothetical protein
MGILSENEIGKKVKISCSGMSEGSRFFGHDPSKPNKTFELAASPGSMFAVKKGTFDVSGGDVERLSKNSIAVVNPSYLLNHKDGPTHDENRNKFTKAFIHELMHLIAGDAHGEHEAAIACSTMCELTTAQGKASDSSKYICALSNEEAENADLIGGQYHYLRYLGDVLDVDSLNASESSLTGIFHGHNSLRFAQNYLNRHNPDLFRKITKSRKDIKQIYAFGFLNFFDKDDPNYSNIKSGEQIEDIGYDLEKKSEVRRYILSRVFEGEDFGVVKAELKEKLDSTKEKSGAKLDISNDFFLWLILSQ